MKKFRDFSITRKLLTGFLSMVLIIVIVAAVGIAGMASISAMDTKLYEEETKPLSHLIYSLESLYQTRVNARDAIIDAGDAKKVQKDEKGYLQYKESFLKESADYRKSLQSQEDLALFDEAADIFSNVYDATVQEMFLLAKAGNPAEANAVLSSATEDIMKLFDNYGRLIENDMASAKATSDTNISTATTLIITLIVIGIISAAVAVYLGLWISRMISRPIGRVVSAARKIALGHVDVELSDIDSKDETGQLASAFAEMTGSIQEQVSIAESISNGDFTKPVRLRSNEDALGLALKKTEQDLNQTLSLINAAADQVGTGASQVSSAAQALASGASEQAATVEELTASISNVAEQAAENARNVRQAAEYMGQTSTSVQRGNEHMHHLNSAMNEIGAASDKISNITKVIEDIAFQTNILALNAAIEAARAGNAGKGFAVVADEVRNLAAKSAEAAKQTADLIRHSTGSVAEGTHVTEQTAQILREIAEKSGLVSTIMEKIDSASATQAAAIEQISQGISQVSAVVQTNAATAEESSASSEELAAQAQMLRGEVGKFKLDGEAAPSYPDIKIASISDRRNLHAGAGYGKY